ncbi:MAG: hypothetical protein ABI562_02180 [Chloroflexota bacterium]
MSPGPITDTARPAGPGPRQPIAERPVDAQDGPPHDAAPAHISAAGAAPAPASSGAQPPDGTPYPHVPPVNGAAHATGGGQPAGFVPHHQPATAGPGDPTGAGGPDRNGQCTAPQLRRFIKSRPYVPMHELRRRFAIDGGDDDVTPVRLDPGWVYVGLPSREGSLLGDLLRAGEIGYELSLDPRTPIVIGVYPMRPIPRS